MEYDFVAQGYFSQWSFWWLRSRSIDIICYENNLGILVGKRDSNMPFQYGLKVSANCTTNSLPYRVKKF